MKIAVCVHEPGAADAVRFVRAALAAGHEIPIVFFYHDGVLTADRHRPDAERPHWLELQGTFGLRLCVCVAAATRRGIAEEEAAPAGESCVDAHFELAGLGQLIGAAMEADRLITFTT